VAPTTEFWPEAPRDRVAYSRTRPFELKSTFQWSGRSPGQARHFVANTLAAWGYRGAVLDDAALIASELATNAVLHARTEFTVVVSRRPGGNIRIAVGDTSLMRPRPRRGGPLETSGRGLRLVEALAGEWGADVLPDGKVIWAELPAEAALSAR
jgi:anti-sigma regulatory factor (Ser/Thr protein kinase)